MSQKEVFYPAIFFQDKEGAYTVQFLDVPGAVTFGENLSEAFKYAQQSLGEARVFDSFISQKVLLSLL